MSHINPTWPTEGLRNWGDEMIAGLGVLVTKINQHDDTLNGRLSEASLVTLIEANLPEPAPITADSITDATTLGKTILRTESASEVRSEIGAAAATHTHTASQISDATTLGIALMKAVDAADARSKIGAAATVHTHVVSDISDTTMIGAGLMHAVNAAAAQGLIEAAPAVHTHTAAQISDASTLGRTILTIANAAAARTQLSAASIDDLAVVEGIAVGAALAADEAIPLTQKGAASGVASLGADSRVPSDQLTPTMLYVGSNAYDSGVIAAVNDGDFFLYDYSAEYPGWLYQWSEGDWVLRAALPSLGPDGKVLPAQLPTPESGLPDGTVYGDYLYWNDSEWVTSGSSVEDVAFQRAEYYLVQLPGYNTTSEAVLKVVYDGEGRSVQWGPALPDGPADGYFLLRWNGYNPSFEEGWSFKSVYDIMSGSEFENSLIDERRGPAPEQGRVLTAVYDDGLYPEWQWPFLPIRNLTTEAPFLAPRDGEICIHDDGVTSQLAFYRMAYAHWYSATGVELA